MTNHIKNTDINIKKGTFLISLKHHFKYVHLTHRWGFAFEIGCRKSVCSLCYRSFSRPGSQNVRKRLWTFNSVLYVRLIQTQGDGSIFYVVRKALEVRSRSKRSSGVSTESLMLEMQTFTDWVTEAWTVVRVFLCGRSTAATYNMQRACLVSRVLFPWIFKLHTAFYNMHSFRDHSFNVFDRLKRDSF